MSTAYKNGILFLKVGVSFAFLYPAISAFIDPSQWIGYVPTWIDLFIPRETFLPVFSTFEILIALAILLSNKVFPAVVAGVMLISIVILNRSEFSVVFRDLSIAAMAFGLAFLLKEK